jgi:hypothetical protein
MLFIVLERRYQRGRRYARGDGSKLAEWGTDQPSFPLIWVAIGAPTGQSDQGEICARRRRNRTTRLTTFLCAALTFAGAACSFLWESQMRPGQASQTLLITSIMRARHQLFDSPLILNDPVVLKLVPEARDPGVLSDFGDSREPKAILARTLLAVRSRFTEDRLAQAAARGVRQYVMFGAGLDTFPWRQPDFAKDMQIFRSPSEPDPNQSAISRTPIR